MRHNWGLPGAAHSLIIPSFTQIIWGRCSHSRYVGAVGTQWRGPLGEECGKEDWQVGLTWGMKASVAGRRAVGKADWPNLPVQNPVESGQCGSGVSKPVWKGLRGLHLAVTHPPM